MSSAVALQLDALGYRVIDATDDLAGAIRALPSGPDRVAVVDHRFIGHTHVLRQVIADDRWSASTAPGVLSVAAGRVPDLLTAAEAGAEPAGDGLDLAPVDALQTRLADRMELNRLNPAPLVAGIASGGDDADALRSRVDAVDEEKVRLKQSVKSDDTFFTAMVVRPYSGYAARWLARIGISPNLVTVLSLAFAVIAAGLAATGGRIGFVGAAIGFHIAFALDCIDGDLARYSVRYSRLGAWLDATFDRLKEYLLFAGLAIGAVNAGDEVWIWGLAAAAMALQTIRHQMNFGYEEVASEPDQAPPLSAEVQARLTGARWKTWLRRAIVLPQGERSALICILVAFTNPLVTFVVLLVAGVLAGMYGAAGRLLRSLQRLHRGWSRRAARALGAMVDVGPVGWILHITLPGRSLPAPVTTLLALILLGTGLGVIGAVGTGWLGLFAVWYALLVGFSSRQPLNGWADWVLPPSYRVAEYAVVLIATYTIAPAALPVAFGFIAASAYHQYDTVYRLREVGSVPPRWLVILTGGHDGRILALSLLAAVTAGTAESTASTVWTVGLVVLTGWLAALFCGESIARMVVWFREQPVGTVHS